MTDVSALYDRLVEGVALRSDDAGIRLVTIYDPAGGPGTRVMPPTYPDGYVTAERVMNGDQPVPTVLLDSYQAQAHRIADAMLDARDDERIALPMFEMRLDVDRWPLRLTSFDLPHRYADAYLRDTTVDGEPFDKTEIGRAFRVATPENAGALYRWEPCSLVFGAWNSHRKGRQPKFARCYRSEVVGVDYKNDVRRGGRLDPYNLTGAVANVAEGSWDFVVAPKERKAKGERLSEIGHGNALGGDGPGGVTVRDARRLGFLSFAALARLRFPEVGRGGEVAARAALAALALTGDRLAFDRAGVVFRSGCELTTRADETGWEQRGGTVDRFDLTAVDALQLFAHAVDRATAAGLPMETETIAIQPISGLRAAIEHAFLAAEPAE